MTQVSGRVGRWFAAARRRVWVGLLAAAVLLIFGVAWVVGPGATWWLEDVDDVRGLTGKDLASALDAVRGRALAVGTGLLALVAVYYTARNADTARQGHVTERFTKAIEQLGSDKLDVRIGGIYALERVARDSARDHPVVMEVVAAFLREHCRDEDARSAEGGWPLRADLQAAFTVIARRKVAHDTDPVNLHKADLRGASMLDADLRNAIMVGADMTKVSLPRANLSGANLNGALLANTQLMFADLSKVNLEGADLSGSDLQRANLRGAKLREAKLKEALLELADLRETQLLDADLTGANLSSADLRGAVGHVNLAVADTKGAKGLPLRSLLIVPGRPLYERDLDELDADGLFAAANDDGRHPDFRIPPAEKLLQLGDPRGADALADMASSTSYLPVERQQAARELIRHSDPRGAELVAEILQTQGAWLREQLEAQAAPPVKLWRRMRRIVTRSVPEPPAALVPASDHPETLVVRYEVAVEQANDGDFAGAVHLLEELVADQDRVAGPNHHDSLVMRGTLADCRGSAGDAAGAVAGLTEVLDRMVRELGEDDPDTVVVRENLIHWQEQVAQEPGPDTVRS